MNFKQFLKEENEDLIKYVGDWAGSLSKLRPGGGVIGVPAQIIISKILPHIDAFIFAKNIPPPPFPKDIKEAEALREDLIKRIKTEGYEEIGKNIVGKSVISRLNGDGPKIIDLINITKFYHFGESIYQTKVTKIIRPGYWMPKIKMLISSAQVELGF